ncbi:MAG: hypothetical protein AAGI44_09110, partial [Pseudomonadota bacterium]
VDKNTSDGFFITKVGHLLWQKNISSNNRQLMLNGLPQTGKMLPSADDARAFYSHFRDSNKLLNERFQLSEKPYLFDDDFSTYPESRTDLWTEDSANEAILTILDTINNVPMLTEADETLLMESARKIEEKNPALAAQLLQILGVKHS